MNLMFWKKKNDATEDGEDGVLDMPDDVIEPEETAEGELGHDEISGDADAEAEEHDGATGSTGLLIAGTVAGILILAIAGFAVWKFFLSSHRQDHAPAQAATQPAPPSGNQMIKLPPIGFRQPAKVQAAKVQPEDHTAAIGASMEKSGETSVEANQVATTRTGQPPVASQQADIDVPAKMDGKPPTQALSSSPDGDLIVGSKDPKSAAVALKEMIDVMNAGSGTSPENAAK